MPRLVLDDFHGGANFRDDPLGLPLRDAFVTLDWVPFGEGGGLIKRNGDTNVADLSADSQLDVGIPPVTTVFPLRRLWYSPSQGWLVQTAEGKIVTPAGFDVYDPGVSAPVGGMDDQAAWFMEAPASGGQGPVYMRTMSSTGTAGYRQWTGSGASAAWTAASGTLPNTSKWFLYIGNRVWAFGVAPNTVISAADRARVWFSELGDPRNWPAANTFQLEPGDSQDFTGGGHVGEVLVIGKRDRCWVIYDLDTGANRPLGEDVGIREMDTCCTTPIGLFFIDENRGPMVTDGLTAKPLKNGNKVGWEQFTNACYANEHIYCLSDNGVTAAVLDYNIRTESWWSLQANEAFIASNVAGQVYGSRAGSDQAHLDELFVEGEQDTAGGSAIHPEWWSPPLTLGARELKRIRRIAIRGEGLLQLSGQTDWPDFIPTTFGGTTKDTSFTEAIWPTLGVVRLPVLKIVGQNGASGYERLDAITIDYEKRAR